MTDQRDEGLEARRRRLGAELNEVKREAGIEQSQERKAEASRKGYAEAMKLSSEFIAAIVVGGVLGYVLDRYAGTGPWGLIVLLLLGFCAGVLNVLRATGQVAQPGRDKRKGL
jgi:ATP synthase protein I